MTGKGVALQYSGEIPRVTARAQGELFKKLIAIAESNNITIYRDPDLTEVLSAVDTGTEIPEELYRAVSEVLSYCYKVNEHIKKKIDSKLQQ